MRVAAILGLADKILNRHDKSSLKKSIFKNEFSNQKGSFKEFSKI